MDEFWAQMSAEEIDRFLGHVDLISAAIPANVQPQESVIENSPASAGRVKKNLSLSILFFFEFHSNEKKNVFSTYRRRNHGN